MRTDWNENHAELVGEVEAEPVFSHTNHGEDYYRLPLRVRRLSGAEDVLNLVISRSQLDECPLTFRNVDTICRVFEQVLSGVFHQRIAYPKIEIPNRGAVDIPAPSAGPREAPHNPDGAQEAAK